MFVTQPLAERALNRLRATGGVKVNPMIASELWTILLRIVPEAAVSHRIFIPTIPIKALRREPLRTLVH
jgi:hypothetical protein